MWGCIRPSCTVSSQMAESSLLKQEKKQHIPLSVPCIRGNEWLYLKDCLDSGWVSSAGTYVDKFEKEIARRVGIPHAVATCSGTAALHVALMISGIQPSDEVIVPTLTFIAPINSVRYVQANPIFMDCDTYLNIDPIKTKSFIEEKCSFDGRTLKNKKTGATIRAIIVVHILGNPVDIEPFVDLSKKYRLTLIEDAAEALGSFYTSNNLKGKYAGSIGTFGCFSFNGNKVVTSGGGGMITTDSGKSAEIAKYLTTQAKDDAELFLHHNVGYNYRLTNLEAAVGLAQLEQLDNFVQTKRSHFLNYKKMLANIDGISFLPEPSYGRSNYWLITVQVNEKKFGLSAAKLRNALRKSNIESRLMWTLNHEQKPYRKYESYQITRAYQVHSECLSLPSSVGLEEKQIKYICEAIKQVAK